MDIPTEINNLISSYIPRYIPFRINEGDVYEYNNLKIEINKREYDDDECITNNTFRFSGYRYLNKVDKIQFTRITYKPDAFESMDYFDFKYNVVNERHLFI